MEINAITLECDSAVNKPRTLFRFTKKRALDAHKNSHMMPVKKKNGKNWGKVPKMISVTKNCTTLDAEGCTKTLPPSIPVNLYAAVDLPSLPGVSRTGGSPSKNQIQIHTNTNTQINVHKCRHLEPTTVIVFARKIQIEHT